MRQHATGNNRKQRNGMRRMQTPEKERATYSFNVLACPEMESEVGSTLRSHLMVGRSTINRRWDGPLVALIMQHRRSTSVQVGVALRFGQSKTYSRA